MKTLVTGEPGYIGSYALIELYAAGHTTVVVDNLSNSNPISLQREAETIEWQRFLSIKLISEI